MTGKSEQYYVEPATLGSIRESLAATVATSGSFAEVCAGMAPLIASEVEVCGLDNIPPEAPVIAIKNHPCHFDVFLLGSLFRIRPDMRLLAKSSALTEPLPPENTIFLRKIGAHAERDDIQAMRTYLGSGGSLLATPWGCMDHQIPDYATYERTVLNVKRFASLGGAAILPIYIDAVRNKAGRLPLLHSAIVTVHEAITVAENGIDEKEIDWRVRGMYEQFNKSQI